jgi:hypothetical protein
MSVVASVRKRTIPTERPPLVSEVSANFFADRGCHVVSVTNPYGRILGFLDRSHYYFFQVALQLNSRGRVDPVPAPLWCMSNIVKFVAHFSTSWQRLIVNDAEFMAQILIILSLQLFYSFPLPE